MAELNFLDPEPEFEDPPPLPDPPRNRPPPLPPRGRTEDVRGPPPPYTLTAEKKSKLVSEQWHSRDPRSSSTHSLVPSESTRDGRRTLLLIYIHGFMGNETSFQSFPAHVHNLLTMTMSATHVVHTKIYPRYKSKRAIEFARDEFGDWLEPHEGPNIDVVLLGHSMGGLLAAEVALRPSSTPSSDPPLQHHLLGTISFDTPFLGMHPGLVTSGIASLFRPAPAPPGSSQGSEAGSSIPSGSTTPSTYSQSLNPMSPSDDSSIASSTNLSITPSRSSSVYTVPTRDPYYDPPFVNDIRLPERSGWGKVIHFVNKHSDGLTAATKQFFVSHIEFGGCLADYQGLKNRYAKIRALEDVDEFADRNSSGHKPPTRRVRFLNYYTASTGIPKKPKVPAGQKLDKEGNLQPDEAGMENLSITESTSRSVTPTASGQYSEEDTANGKMKDVAKPSSFKTQMVNLGDSSGVQEFEDDEPPAMRHIDSMPIQDDNEDQVIAPELSTTTTAKNPANSGDANIQATTSELPLPPIPAVPEEPKPIDLNAYTDKDDRKIAEKEQKRVIKAYHQAVKDRENAIKDRQKLVEKREKKSRQEQEKRLKEEEKLRQKEAKEEEKRQATINPEVEEEAATVKSEKPKKDRKFCLLPSDVNGHRDKCWVRIYMEGVDEVGAHCGLFFPGPQYESLVGDVGARVEEWVKDDATRRAILEAEDVD